MNFKEYGDSKNNTIMLLHGGGLSWWNYKEEAESLKNNYHIILPILDGHAESDKHFTSIEDNAQEIIDYINNNYNGHISLLGGLSLGGQVLLEILSKKNDICDYAIIESALALPMKATHKMVRPVFSMSYTIISKKWFSKMQFNSLKIKKDLFEDYYRDTCKIEKEDMISFMEANSRYDIKSTLEDTTAKTLIVVGDKERPIMKKSADIIHQKIKESKIEIIPNYSHGEFSINNPMQYIKALETLIAD
ncbi:MAG: alpha/beta hydrolase [Clostridiales bacterium]|nr:alpha/beta hydrolase [Clostridiales bacterium]